MASSERLSERLSSGHGGRTGTGGRAAVRVEHDAPRIGVLLEVVADREAAELRRVAVPADRAHIREALRARLKLMQGTG